MRFLSPVRLTMKFAIATVNSSNVTFPSLLAEVLWWRLINGYSTNDTFRGAFNGAAVRAGR